MEIVNKGNYFTNNQLSKLVNLAKLGYAPSKLIICESRKDMAFLYKQISLLNYLITILDVAVWFGKVEGIYLSWKDTIVIYVFSQNDDGENKQSKQLYSIHALMHELRHVWQRKTKFTRKKEKDADDFANKIVNSKSKKISKIMNWKDEWEVEEE